MARYATLKNILHEKKKFKVLDNLLTICFTNKITSKQHSHQYAQKNLQRAICATLKKKTYYWIAMFTTNKA